MKSTRKKKFVKRKSIKPTQLLLIRCVDGPSMGESTTVQVINKMALMPLPRNPIYKCAMYLVLSSKTNLGEYLAMFSHCVKR